MRSSKIKQGIQLRYNVLSSSIKQQRTFRNIFLHLRSTFRLTRFDDYRFLDWQPINLSSFWVKSNLVHFSEFKKLYPESMARFLQNFQNYLKTKKYNLYTFMNSIKTDSLSPEYLPEHLINK